jgi:hypothetical protein
MNITLFRDATSTGPYGVTPEKKVFLLITELAKKTGGHANTGYTNCNTGSVQCM